MAKYNRLKQLRMSGELNKENVLVAIIAVILFSIVTLRLATWLAAL